MLEYGKSNFTIKLCAVGGVYGGFCRWFIAKVGSDRKIAGVRRYVGEKDIPCI